MLLALAQEAVISVAAARLRTFLAMLGIVIGVGSVVLMLAIGSGSRQAIEDAIERLGTNLLIISSSANTETKGLKSSKYNYLTRADAVHVSQLPTIAAAAPVTNPRSLSVAALGKTANTQVMGTTGDFFQVRNWPIEQGDNFSAEDERMGNRVAIIGASAASKLFEDKPPLGNVVRINKMPFRIIGLLGAKGQGFDGRDQDDIILVPLTTAQRKLFGGRAMAEVVPMIFAQGVSKDYLAQAEEDIMELLREKHKVRSAEQDPFSVRSLSSISATATATARALSILLGAIASISLVVGGIGIMNIMLVTVTERTREIGIRKAIGATNRDVMVQFLLESVMISAIGSVIGLILGIGGALAAEYGFGMNVKISFWSVVVSLSVAVIVGVLSGLYPARRASKLQPIEALRQVGG